MRHEAVRVLHRQKHLEITTIYNTSQGHSTEIEPTLRFFPNFAYRLLTL